MNAERIKTMLRPSHEWDKHTLSQKVCDRLVAFVIEQDNQVKQLQAEVEMFENRESMALEYAESLKNCANCRHIIWEGEVELLCSKNWVGDRFEKCRHWQKAGE